MISGYETAAVRPLGRECQRSVDLIRCLRLALLDAGDVEVQLAVGLASEFPDRIKVLSAR